jgi:hypothetical protein
VVAKNTANGRIGRSSIFLLFRNWVPRLLF